MDLPYCTGRSNDVDVVVCYPIVSLPGLGGAAFIRVGSWGSGDVANVSLVLDDVWCESNWAGRCCVLDVRPRVVLRPAAIATTPHWTRQEPSGP